VEIGKIDAVVVKQVLPKYPIAMWQRGIEGRVVLEIAVDAQGKVVDIITLSTSDWLFANEARRAVWQWQFAASARMQPDERTHYLLPIEFKLRSG
jgi:TonB family protein